MKTYVLLLEPKTCADLDDVEGELDSQIVDVVPPVLENPPHDFSFPLRGDWFLCTQGAGGRLSHFVHASTYYAVDFRCEPGTPVLAVADGTVIDVQCHHKTTSIHCSALFQWNSLLLRVDTDYVEYVHISKSLVKKGATVRRGDVIAASGAVGFCPEPHLHIQRYATSDPNAPSLPIAFRHHKGHRSPRAGELWPGAPPVS